MEGNIIRKIMPDTTRIIQGKPSFTQIEESYEGSSEYFRVKKIPFISYYYEYPFPVLKDMALFYLDVLEDLLKSGYSLSDGTPFNCTYTGNKKFEFFDLGSIVQFDKNKGWEGYKQFLTDFYYPLVYLSDLKSIYPGALLPFINDSKWMFNIEFSFKQRWRLPNILFSDFIRRSLKKDLDPKSANKIEISNKGIEKIIALLRSAISNLNYKKPKTKWDDYYTNTILKNYLEEKERLFKQLYEKASAQVSANNLAVDWGANTGHFSHIMANVNSAVTVIAVESDHNAISELYQQNKADKIIPIHSSIFNPIPAAGFEYNRESLLERLSKRAFIQSALGLIHHMQHELNLSYDDIVNFFYNSSLPDSFLIIEYVDPADDRYRLIRNPNYPFPEGENAFAESLNKKYTIIERHKPIATRELFLVQKRG
jgi:hypothetical protein